MLAKLGCRLVSADNVPPWLWQHHLVRRGVFFAEHNVHQVLTRRQTVNVTQNQVLVHAGRGSPQHLANGQVSPLYYQIPPICHQVPPSPNQDPPLYVFTGRGPSSRSLHFGHLLPFMLVQHVQKHTHSPLVLQLSDDEKFFHGRPTHADANLAQLEPFLDASRTHVIVNSRLTSRHHDHVRVIQRHLSIKAIKRHFGYTDDHCVGLYAYVATQVMPCIPQALDLDSNSQVHWNCLVVAGHDQFPYFSLARQVRHRLQTPGSLAMLYGSHLPALKGPTAGKSSSSQPATAVFLDDPDDVIQRKLRGAFSCPNDGSLDTAMQYMRCFESSDDAYEQLQRDHANGTLSSLALKSRCAQMLIDLRNQLYPHGTIMHSPISGQGY